MRIIYRVPNFIYLVIGLIFSSCADDSELFLPETLEISAYDLDNNGNSSDIRVDFKVENNLNVEEYRVMIIPAKDTASFNLANANSVGIESYVAIKAVPFETNYSIKRFPSGILDINGSPVTNNAEYVTALLIVGIESRKITKFSKPFALIDQGIYSGYYEGEGCCCCDGFLSNQLSKISGQMTGFSGSYAAPIDIVYEVSAEISTLEESNISFVVVDSIVSEFRVSTINPDEFTSKIFSTFESGTGKINNDLFLEITFVPLVGPRDPYVISLRRIH